MIFLPFSHSSRTRDTGRALALSKSGLRWWKDAYYITPGDLGRNRRSDDLFLIDANERRVKGLLNELRAGASPKLCTLLVFFGCLLALAKARELVATAAMGEANDTGASQPSQSMLMEPSASRPSAFQAERSIPEESYQPYTTLSGEPDDYADTLFGTPASLKEKDDRTRDGLWGHRNLNDIPESASLLREQGQTYDRRLSGELLNRPIDSQSPHWWQNLRQDGSRSFGGTAERSQTSFSQSDWSDWHGGAGERGAYTHRPFSNPGVLNDPDVAAGPLELDLVGFLSSEYTDNRELTEEDKAAGFVIAGGINATATLDITETNKLHLNIGVGVDQFVGDDTEDDGMQLHVTPDTFADLDLGIGDLELRIFDRFLLRRNQRFSSFSPDAVDTSDFWRNTAGLSAFYPLNDALSIHGTVDLTRDKSLEEGFDEINNDTLTGSAGLTLSPNGEYTLGVQGTMSQRDYDTDFNNDADVSSVGLFAHSPISDFTRLEANGGYQNFDFSTGGASGDTDQLADYYVSLAIRNELNDMMTHSLIGGHGADYGSLSNFEAYDFVRYELTAEPTDSTSIDLAVGYRWNDESGVRNAQDETLNIALHGSQRLTDHLVLGVRGAFTRNEANLEGRDYDEKRLQAYARLQLNDTANLNLSYQRWDVSGNESNFVENSVVTGMSVDF